jgi:Thioredoxin
VIRALAIALLVGCGHPATPTPVAAAKSVQLNQPGEPVELAPALPLGYVSVVDFWSESCGACTIVGGMLAVQVANADGVVIRKVDVGDGFTAVAKQFQIGALPHYNIYDKAKKLRYVLVGNDCLKAPELAIQLAAE